MSDTADTESRSTSSSPNDAIQQMMQAMDALRAFMAKQETINSQVLARQDGIFELLDRSAESDEDEKERELVRNSRHSISMMNSGNNITLNSPGTFAPPKVRPRTIDELDRRASGGTTSTPAQPTRTLYSNAAAHTPSKSTLQSLDKSRNSPYDRVAQVLARGDKWYGDRKHDKDIDVYSFVRSVEHTMNMWMEDERRGRLDLVINCTAGPAQAWLLSKQDDCKQLIAGGVKPENADWDVVREMFMQQMGGGQTQRLYQSRLESLTLGKGDGDEVVKFITKFTEYAMRAYPLDTYPDTTVRSLLLGKVFGERVAASDITVWQEAWRDKPAKLEEWEAALSRAWVSEQIVREQRKKHGWNNRGNRDDTVPPVAQRVNNMDAEGDSEALNAVASNRPTNKTGGGQKKPDRPRNKHLDRKKLIQLMQLNRCLQCYKSGHIARDCQTPANRPPTEAELN